MDSNYHTECSRDYVLASCLGIEQALLQESIPLPPESLAQSKLCPANSPKTLQTFKAQLWVPSDMTVTCTWLAPCVKNVKQTASAHIISSNHLSHFSPARAEGHIHLVTVC